MCRSHVLLVEAILAKAQRRHRLYSLGSRLSPLNRRCPIDDPSELAAMAPTPQNYTLDTAFSVQPFLRPNYPGCPPPIGGGLRYQC